MTKVLLEVTPVCFSILPCYINFKARSFSLPGCIAKRNVRTKHDKYTSFSRGQCNVYVQYTICTYSSNGRIALPFPVETGYFPPYKNAGQVTILKRGGKRLRRRFCRLVIFLSFAKMNLTEPGLYGLCGTEKVQPTTLTYLSLIHI